MKKVLLTAIISCLFMSLAGVAGAATDSAKVKIDGSLTLQYRTDDFDTAQAQHDYKSIFFLNAASDLTKNLGVYARFSYEGFANTADREFPQARDYNFNISGADGVIDSYGLKYKNAGLNYTVGAQPLSFGMTGIMYDDHFVGKNAIPYAISTKGKVGATDFQAVIAKTNYQGIDNDKIYEIQGNYAINNKASVGAAYAAVQYGKDNPKIAADMKNNTINYYTLNTTYKLADNLSFTGEYLKSTASQDNQGYYAGLTYKPNKKDTIGAAYWRIEDQAAIIDANIWGSLTYFWGNAEGTTFSYQHKIKKDIILNVVDHNWDNINSAPKTTAGGRARDSFRAGITVLF